MLCYQPKFFEPTKELTSDLFAQLVVSDHVTNAVRQVRRLKGEAKACADEAQAKALLKEADKWKRSLPMVIWQATFDESLSSKGNPGRWRKQAAARLNGLFMVDIDHIAPLNPPEGGRAPLSPPQGGKAPLSPPQGGKSCAARAMYEGWRRDHPELFSDYSQTTLSGDTSAQLFPPSGGPRGAILPPFGGGGGGPFPPQGGTGGAILLVHVTPSGQGLRIVAKADAGVGNLSDNQHHLAQLLGVTIDESCKDASRVSFCPMFDDILFINKQELFTYDNPDYDEKFGPLYRGGNSRPTRLPAGGGAGSGKRGGEAPQNGGDMGPGHGQGAAAAHDGLDERLVRGYHGTSYNDICNAWLQKNCGGKPKPGDRHQSLYRMACDLRYVTDSDPLLLARVLSECEVGRDIAQERGADEIKRIASDACALRRYQGLPQRLQGVLALAGVQLDGAGDDAKAAKAPAIDYEAYAQRLEPLLSDSPGLREAVAPLPRLHRLGGVLAAGAMLGTYLTRTWWEHFDGKYYRLSFLCYVVGAAASGKSFITDLDRLLMDPLKVTDRIGREAEQQYKNKQRARKANEQLPEQPHPVIRYCPSTTSNAILYRRLQDAVDKNVTDPQTGEPLHLHLITVESELATALRAQVGSWAGKGDLELKSFHNETAGVDFANAESTNGIMQINWNQVVSGTRESMSRKIKPANVLDGLVTRLALFIMPGNEYEMLERRRAVRDHGCEAMLRALGYKLEEVKGELRCDRLVEFCFDYEAELTRQARMEQDRCLDYFRKRIPVIMVRYALVRAVLRQVDDLLAGKPLNIEDSDLEFARLIGDWCLEAQIYMFGQMVMDALEKENEAFMPRKYYTKTREAYNALPVKFTYDDMLSIGLVKTVAAATGTVVRWRKDGLVEAIEEKTFKKKIKQL